MIADPSITLPLLLGLSRSIGSSYSESSSPPSIEELQSLPLSKRIHRLLSSSSKIAEWREHGRAFCILDEAAFSKIVIHNDDGDANDNWSSLLNKEGFHQLHHGKDKGCWYKDGFTKRGPNEACILHSNAEDTTKASNEVVGETSPEIRQFQSVTATTNDRMARRYLEMSGGNVEMAVTLFLEGGGVEMAVDMAAADDHENNDTAKTNKEEPNFYTLPPVKEGRASPAETIVGVALKEYWAFRTLRRALLSWIQRRPRRISSSFTSISRSTDSFIPYREHGTSHFLLQSLIHPNLHIRRTSARMFLHNLHQIRTESEYNYAVMAMQESIVLLLHRVLFDEATPYETQRCENPRLSVESKNSMQQANEGDPAIQLLGMLTCLVCEGGFGNVLVGDCVKSLDEKKNDSLTLSSSSSSGLLFSQLREMSSFSIESFVASGGLRWVCGCIVRLVHSLAHAPLEEGSDINSHKRCKDEAVNNELIQRRLVLLIDLVYRLVLFGTVPSAVDGEKARTSMKPVDGEDDTNLDGKPSAKSAPSEDGQKKRKRNNLSHFYELMARANRGGDTGDLASSRTSALRSSIRSTLASRGVGSPPLPSGKDKTGNDDGDKQVSPEVAEENRLRRERRKATLERVHSMFWNSTLPAALCVGKRPTHDNFMDTSQDDELFYGSFSPLACLVAAYEILRSPYTRFDDATNKAIAILSRLVDPAAGYCLVISDSEIPWGLSTLLWGDEKAVEKAESSITHQSRSRKRDRSASQESQRSRSPHSRSVSATLHEALRSKRQRTRRTQHVASLLERLSDPTRETRENSYSPAAALASSSQYSSLLLRGAGGPSPASSSANRDGSLSRIIADAEERSGLGELTSIRARAVLDRSPGDWRMIASASEQDDEGVVMMDEDDDNDTEFEQDQEDGQGDEIDDMPDEDEDGGDDEGDDEDGDEGDENGEDTDEGEDSSVFDDAVIVMDQVTAPSNDDREQQRNNPHRRSNLKSHSRADGLSLMRKEEHERAYLRAAMEILNTQYLTGNFTATSKERRVNACSVFFQPPAVIRSPLLTLSAEQSLMQSMCDIVKPPKKPLNLKIFMRRAPSQEEFFRGALSRNPINLSSLKAETTGGDDTAEPTFADLRKHIAKDLQMEDSAELLELLVASKIIDINVKLRVAQQVLWKKYVLENSTSASSLISGAGPGHQMINTGSGLSMIFSSNGLSGRLRESGADELDVTQLPPMVVTYRLAGVDGEATEDKVEVGDLEDPEAVNITCPKALEKKMEKEFGITRAIANHGGIAAILSSVQSFIDQVTARIRRDEIRLRKNTPSCSDENAVRASFAKNAPCPGLLLLRHCANLAENRQKLLAARAPTMLLRMLLDVLNAMNRSTTGRQRSLTFDGMPSNAMDVDETPRDANKDISSSAETNPTTNALQEIIEMLASDISAEVADDSVSNMSKSSSFVNLTQADSKCDNSTLPLVLKSLRTANLSPPLRKVISKLLPFLTYGQVDQSQELADFFVRYIKLEHIAASGSNHDFDMMNTFIDTATNLPPVSVCDNLRQALLSNKFVDKIKSFIMLQAPMMPPPWSPALYQKQLQKKKPSNGKKVKEEWRIYFNRTGLVEAFKILIGLCSKHHPTQIKLSEEETGDDTVNLLNLCHWIESTSDNESSGIKTNGLGILCETLLDALKEGDIKTSDKVSTIRKITRDRKREIAEERRNKALVGMSAFGTLAGSAVAGSIANTASAPKSSEQRSTSMIASMFGLSAFSSSASSSQRETQAATNDSIPEEKIKPSWMVEMEAMEEESGLTCAVCQEGRTLQPTELLGLYAYMKKVTIPSSQGGDKAEIDGTILLLSLPVSCPRSIKGSPIEPHFKKGKVAANALQGTSQALSAMSSSSSITGSASNRTTFITTVSAGNAIHCTCHAKAKAADRSHPKAPKSEWEGASLRNSRVTCNIVLPLASSKTSSVPLIAVESALGEVNSITTTILGSRPKSMLWNVLHDVRLLMLRMAYGEALNADCGGGSSSSNFLLILYQLYTADMLSKNADIDDSQVSRHARGLSSGFIAASNIVDSVDFARQDSRSKRLERGVADAAPMAAICSILFYNSTNESATASSTHNLTDSDSQAPSPNRQWELHKDKFLSGLLRCAGHRNSMGVTDSGCASSRGISTGNRKNVARARSFVDWTIESSTAGAALKRAKGRSILDDYAVTLRPMITLYAILNALSKVFAINDSDENTLDSSNRLASVLESCLKSSCIADLLNVAEITMEHDAICKYFEKGLLI